MPGSIFILFNNKKTFIVIISMVKIILLLNSCTSLRTGIYLVSIDSLNGEAILQNEPNVRLFIENVINNYEDYSIKAFERTGLSFQFRRSRLLTHSYYVIIQDDEKFWTLSFYGTQTAFRSEGAWALNADSDMDSYMMYLDGNNKWDVNEIFPENSINVRKTIENIIDKMNSNITFYYRNHIRNRENMDNCNTALYDTIVLNDVSATHPEGTGY